MKHVVCIMPTRGREAFARHSVAMFRRQTHPAKSLIIVNSGDRYEGLDEDGDADVIQIRRTPEDDEAIQPQRSRAERAAGVYEGGWWSLLRNVRYGIAYARSSLQFNQCDAIAMWEDDDWYHRNRLAAQVEGIGDHDAHGWNFAYWYHAVYRQSWFERYDGTTTAAPALALNTCTMVSARLALRRLFVWDGMFWGTLHPDRRVLDHDASWTPFIAIKHGIGPTINNGHLREEVDPALDGTGDAWFRSIVEPESYAFYATLGAPVGVTV